jgi:hypothetical protein
MSAATCEVYRVENATGDGPYATGATRDLDGMDGPDVYCSRRCPGPFNEGLQVFEHPTGNGSSSRPCQRRVTGEAPTPHTRTWSALAAES